MSIMKKTNIYHPKLDDVGNIIDRGRRDSLNRLKAIRNIVNFKGTTVLDLGCQSGYFCFDISKDAKKVIGVDADIKLIDLNKTKLDQEKIDNIEFIHSKITSDLINSLSDIDIILCLSVFHHIMVDTDLHEFDSSLTKEHWTSLLEALQKKSKILVFEIGNPDEKQPWAKELRKIIRNSDTWVIDNVFGNNFQKIISIPGENYNHKLIKTLPWLRKPLLQWPYGRKFMRILGMAPHDFRKIYIGIK